MLLLEHFKSGLKSVLRISQSYDFNYSKELQNIKKHKWCRKMINDLKMHRGVTIRTTIHVSL